MDWAQDSGRSHAARRNLGRHWITLSLSPAGCGERGDGQDDGAEGDHACSEGSVGVCYPSHLSNHLLLYLRSGEMKRVEDLLFLLYEGFRGKVRGPSVYSEGQAGCCGIMQATLDEQHRRRECSLHQTASSWGLVPGPADDLPRRRSDRLAASHFRRWANQKIKNRIK